MEKEEDQRGDLCMQRKRIKQTSIKCDRGK